MQFLQVSASGREMLGGAGKLISRAGKSASAGAKSVASTLLQASQKIPRYNPNLAYLVRASSY